MKQREYISTEGVNQYLDFLIDPSFQGVNKKGFAITLYRSPNQSKDEFDQFLLNFEQLMSEKMNQNLHFILVI